MRGGRGIRGWVCGSVDEALQFSDFAGVTTLVEAFPLEEAAAGVREDDERHGAFPRCPENLRMRRSK